MGYIYSALWFVTAFILLVRFRKESIVIYILSAYFIFAGGWWLTNELIDIDLMGGLYGWILRIVSVVMLIVVAAVYMIEKNLKEKKNEALTQDAEQELQSADNV